MDSKGDTISKYGRSGETGAKPKPLFKARLVEYPNGTTLTFEEYEKEIVAMNSMERGEPRKSCIIVQGDGLVLRTNGEVVTIGSYEHDLSSARVRITKYRKTPKGKKYEANRRGGRRIRADVTVPAMPSGDRSGETRGGTPSERDKFEAETVLEATKSGMKTGVKGMLELFRTQRAADPVTAQPNETEKRLEHPSPTPSFEEDDTKTMKESSTLPSFEVGYTKKMKESSTLPTTGTSIQSTMVRI